MFSPERACAMGATAAARFSAALAAAAVSSPPALPPLRRRWRLRLLLELLRLLLRRRRRRFLLLFRLFLPLELLLLLLLLRLSLLPMTMQSPPALLSLRPFSASSFAAFAVAAFAVAALAFDLSFSLRAFSLTWAFHAASAGRTWSPEALMRPHERRRRSNDQASTWQPSTMQAAGRGPDPPRAD